MSDNPGNPATFLSSSSFRLQGNRTLEADTYRRIRAYCGAVDGHRYSAIQSSSYDSGSDKTTIVLLDPVLTVNLQEVWFGVVSPSELHGSLPLRGIRAYLFGWTHVENDKPSWQGTTSYSSGSLVVPTSPNGFMYEAEDGGDSGMSEPTWPTTIGATVDDGDITWVCKPFHTCAAFENIILDAGLKTRLPSGPSAGDEVHFAVGGDWESNPPDLLRNGEKIMGVADDMQLDTNVSLSLVYQGATRGWVFAR